MFALNLELIRWKQHHRKKTTLSSFDLNRITKEGKKKTTTITTQPYPQKSSKMESERQQLVSLGRNIPGKIFSKHLRGRWKNKGKHMGHE